jgi:hypothetical protein
MKLWDDNKIKIPENKKSIINKQDFEDSNTQIEDDIKNDNVITTDINVGTDRVDTKEPPFIKLYLNDIVLLKNLPSSYSSILYELMKLMTWDNKIVLNSSIKKNIMAALNIKTSTLNNTLSQFVKKKILYRLDVGVYMPNPYLFARGDYSDINQLRLIIDYIPKTGDRNISVEVDGVLIEE